MAATLKVAVVGALVLALSGFVAPAGAQAPPGSLSVNFTQTIDCAAVTETLTLTLSQSGGGDGLTFTIGDATITAQDGAHPLAFDPNPLAAPDLTSTAVVTVPFGGVTVQVPYTIGGFPNQYGVGFSTIAVPFDRVCPTPPPETSPPVTPPPVTPPPVAVVPVPGGVPPTVPPGSPGVATPVSARPNFTG